MPPRGEALSDQPQDGDSMGGEADAQYADQATESPKEQGRDLAEPMQAIDFEKSKKIQRLARSFLYDEWNHEASRYLRSWCRVLEQRLTGEDTQFIQAVRKRNPALWQQVKRVFATLKPTSFKKVRRASDGDELDLERIIEARAERNIEHQADEAPYIWRERALRDVSVAFLVDMSASTSIVIPAPRQASDAQEQNERKPVDTDPNTDYPYLYGGGMSARFTGASEDSPEPHEEPRRVIDAAQDAVALMCDALHHLGDDFAVYGFSGDGREKVDFFIAKDFNDPLGGRTWAAIAAMQPKQSSRVGPAIRHSIHKVRKQATGRRLLIVISDGYPQDRDYGPTIEDVEYGIQDTARALREAEQQGIQTFFVTIDPAGYDYLGRMCPENRYLLIDDVLQLPAALSKIYQAMKVAPSRSSRSSRSRSA
jgi:nitric oxide reductase NorD protein